MTIASPIRLLGWLLIALAVWPVQAAEPKQPLTIFAAASLKGALDEAAGVYEKQTGTPARISYAATSALARQIENNAPADVFFSADLEWMDYLQARRKIDTANRRNLLGNRLVLVAPKNSRARVDLNNTASLTAALGDRRLAVGQTRSVPAGKYARASLESLRMWDSVASKLAESESVRAALMLVARGEAPLGIVYLSDAQAEPAVRVVAVFPDDSHPAIVYPVAPLSGNRHPQAAAFVHWLSSSTAQKIFRRHGFAVLP